MNRWLKNTEFIRKELSSIIKNNSSTRRYSQISLSADVRASATSMSHPVPFSVAASQTHCARADRDYCWRRAPVTGVNKRETTISEICSNSAGANSNLPTQAACAAYSVYEENFVYFFISAFRRRERICRGESRDRPPPYSFIISAVSVVILRK